MTDPGNTPTGTLLITAYQGASSQGNSLSDSLTFMKTRCDRYQTFAQEDIHVKNMLSTSLADASNTSAHYGSILKDITKTILEGVINNTVGVTETLEKIENSVLKMRLTPDLSSEMVEHYMTSLCRPETCLNSIQNNLAQHVAQRDSHYKKISSIGDIIKNEIASDDDKLRAIRKELL